MGRQVYGVAPAQPGLVALAMLLVLAVGSALGVLITVVVRSESAAAPIANAIGLPLMMASGVFFPLESTPDWFATMAQFLPFTRSVELAVDAYAGNASSHLASSATLTAGMWALVAGFLAVRYFVWAPRKRR